MYSKLFFLGGEEEEQEERRRRSSPQRFGCDKIARPNINFAVSGGAVINRRWRLAG